MDALIFDVDGTLWDARVPIAHAWNDSLSRYTGKPSHFTPEFLGQYFGRTMEELLFLLLPEAPMEEQLRFGDRCFQEENVWLETEPGTLYPGVEETLKKLGEKYPLYIVSNCQRGYIEVMLKTTGIGSYFRGYLSYGQTGEGKAKNLVSLCNQYGLKDPIYVGDTQGDQNACEEAGIPMIYAAYGLGQVEKPWKEIQSFPELLNLV